MDSLNFGFGTRERERARRANRLLERRARAIARRLTIKAQLKAERQDRLAYQAGRRA